MPSPRARAGSPQTNPRPKLIVYFIGLTAALAGLLFGLDVGVISGAEGFIQKDFQISDDAIQFIVSALLWGAACGALFSGVLSSRLGRRKTILISAINFIIGALLCAFAPNEHVLIGARFLLGIAVGVASFTAPLYLSEIAPQSVRGSLISMYQLMITIGIVIAFLSNTFLATYATFGGVTGGHWRIMLGVIAIPAAVMFTGVCFLPESPRWLFLKGFRERAIDVFKRMKLDASEIASEVQEIEDSLKVRQNGFELFKTNRNFRRAIALGVGLQIVNAIVGMTFLTLINTFGPANTFLLYGGMNLLFIIFFLIFVPETKGVSLERIERNLMSSLPLRRIGR
jgi:MFS transporter, SP family, galactose:H+ symporter